MKNCISDLAMTANNLSKEINSLNYIDPINNLNGLKEKAIEVCLKSEALTCNIRSYISAYMSIPKNELMELIAENQIYIHKVPTENVLSIRMPLLITKKQAVKSNSFMIDCLYYSINKYIREHLPDRFQDCVMCFYHVHSADKTFRDYDNLEIKNVKDTIATFFLIDDSSRYCDEYHSTIPIPSDNIEYTLVILTDKRTFAKIGKSAPYLFGLSNVSHKPEK